MAGRNLQAYTVFIALITSPGQTQIFRGTKGTLNMYHAMQLHSPGTAASGRNMWNPGSLEFLILGHFSEKAPETLHVSSSDTDPQHRAISEALS